MYTKFQHVDFTNTQEISENLDEMMIAGGRLRADYFGKVIRAGFAAVTAYFKRQIAYRELSSLDDRLLADIGINRGDIESYVDGTIERYAANSNKADRDAA
jgi:uncharacterized protein YjiS (DUF1127 family)